MIGCSKFYIFFKQQNYVNSFIIQKNIYFCKKYTDEDIISGIPWV